METQSSLGETKHIILVLLLDGESTGEGLAQRLDMNLSVVRRHLDDMAANKLVGSSFRREGRGRPRKYYSIAAEGRNRISAKYDLVCRLLLEKKKKEIEPDVLRDTLRSVSPRS